MQSSDLMVVYYVFDMERAHAFYRDAVGLAPQAYSPGWTEMTCGEVTVALHALPKDSDRGLTQVPTLNLRVDELEPAVEKVVKAGGQLIAIREAQPHVPVRLAELKDTEGNMFEFRQPV